ncbi:MAG TPA: HAMP domain-containing protein [Nitrospirales bacterium]|nr:HAMP domain-containing protein [Nitrospirales bacterium]
MHSETTLPQSKLNLRPVWITLLFLLPCLGITYVLNEWTGDTPYIPSQILVLTMVNVDLILLVLLALFLSRNLVKAFFERHYGSGFQSKLILAFVGFSLIPSGLLFLVASGLLTNSVNNWFSIQVEQSLNNALEVAQAYYQDQQVQIQQSGQAIRDEIVRRNLLSPRREKALRNALERKRVEHGLAAVEVWSPQMDLLASATDPHFPEGELGGPMEPVLEQAIAGVQELAFETTSFGKLMLIAVPITSSPTAVASEADMANAIVVAYRIFPESVVAKGDEIVSSYEDYRQLKAFKNPIKTAYIVSFAVIAMTIVFSAAWFGIYFARRITVPMEKLAEGTKAVAAGNLSVHIDAKADGEMGTLVESFNTMANDLRVSNAELVKAQKVAAWREVAQRMAHEIKNPLTPIQLSAQRLRKKALEGADGIQQSVQDATGIIINEVQSLMRLVDSFSTFARMPEPVMAEESLHDVIRDVSMLYTTAQRDVEVHYSLDDAVPPISIDREQMKRVFVNLFENAIEAMDHKGRIWVRTRYDAQQRKVHVEVEDEGKGIPPEDRERLFLPYFSNTKNGTGLGLAIVNRIITDHYGQIRVVSDGLIGTTFAMELVVGESEADVAPVS